MITLWTVLGRAALDADHLNRLTFSAQLYDQDKNQRLMQDLQADGNNISVFEVWELSRFLRSDANAAASGRDPILPQVLKIYSDQADEGTFLSPAFHAVIGLALIDQRFAEQVDKLKDASDVADGFLTR